MQQAAEQVRQPAVAGRFYPGQAGELRRMVDELLAEAEVPDEAPAPRALALPHAGYPFSGAAAAQGYARLAPIREQIERVLLLGPSHFVDIPGMALPTARGLATPLGTVPVSEAMREAALEDPAVMEDDRAHAREHSLEVHLPFLQATLPTLELLPVAVGRCSPESCGGLIERFWREDTLVVVSTDLSHFHDDATARRLDTDTTRAIEAGEIERITPERACGSAPLKGLMWFAQRHGLRAETIAQCNSGDVTGDRSAVVGYGSYVFH